MKYYFVKMAGSTGNIYDFSNAFCLSENELHIRYRYPNLNIKYAYFDERINFHVWHLLGDIDGYKQQHLSYIYSTTDKHPELSNTKTRRNIKSNMEQFLNKVELQGVVNTVVEYTNPPSYKVSLVTNLAYKLEGNTPVIESTFHTVLISQAALQDGYVPRKLDKVRIEGRIKNNRETDSNGRDHIFTTIIATKCIKLDDITKIQKI